MPIAFEFDFKNPDYKIVFEWRVGLLAKIREQPAINVPIFKEYYKHHIADFITHWGYTYDPRNVEIDLPARVPMVLYEKQEECVNEIVLHWKARKPLLIPKSREVGMSWIAISTACSLCLFYDELAIGFGSRVEEYVDKIGDPKSLFWKARYFIAGLPREFRGTWNTKTHSSHMKIAFPDSGSVLIGEGGDNIGRGNRTSIYFVDESAYVARPQLTEASLSSTTNCRIDLSSVNGPANPFAQKVLGGKLDVFRFSWRDDPRKDDAWYAKKQEELDPITIAQEIDMNFNASIEGAVIPTEWVQASFDAHIKLGIEVTGRIGSSLDVADQGVDKNAIATAKGIYLFDLQEWSGKDSDTLYTAERAFKICDELGSEEIDYDADGLGAFVRGDGRMINERRTANSERQILVRSFRGSGAVVNPEADAIKGRKNKDYFSNAKAQAWWNLRYRFQNTFRAVRGEIEIVPANLISIASKIQHREKLMQEFAQVAYVLDVTGKIKINKTPDGMKSPNLGDAVMMRFAPKRSGLFTRLKQHA